MGISSSKQKARHEPYPLAPPNGYGYGYGHGPTPNFGQGFISSNGPVFPPGFVPNYGQMPQPQLSWPQERPPERSAKRKKTTRRKEVKRSESRSQRENATQAQTSAPVIPGHGQHRPDFALSNIGSLAGFPSPQPVQNAARRAQTPFQRAPSIDPSDDPPQAHARSQSHSHAGLGIRNPDAQDPERTPQPGSDQRVPTQIYSPRPPQQSTDTHRPRERLLTPISPALPSAYGPPDASRLRGLSSNPLPPPPRDLYETSPYKTLLDLPQTIPLLTSYGRNHIPKAEPKTEPKKPKKGGLFRAFSTKKPEQPPKSHPEVRFIPVFVPGPGGNNSSSSSDRTAPASTSTHPPSNSAPPTHAPPIHSPQPPAQPHFAQPPGNAPHNNFPPQPPTFVGAAFTNNAPFPASFGSGVKFGNNSTITAPGMGRLFPEEPEREGIPMPPPPPSKTKGPPIYFNQDTEFAPFLNHSSHHIFYEHKTYPTATHLLEAMKFLPHRQDIAEQIRACDDIGDVYPLSARHYDVQDPTWSTSYLQLMEKVLYLKFTQNADLRSLLTNTDNSPLIYDDPSDSYWGIGPGNGENKLGGVLEHVRERLMEGRRR